MNKITKIGIRTYGNEELNKKIQNLVFKFGFSWQAGGKEYKHLDCNYLFLSFTSKNNGYLTCNKSPNIKNGKDYDYIDHIYKNSSFFLRVYNLNQLNNALLINLNISEEDIIILTEITESIT